MLSFLTLIRLPLRNHFVRGLWAPCPFCLYGGGRGLDCETLGIHVGQPYRVQGVSATFLVASGRYGRSYALTSCANGSFLRLRNA